MNVLIRSSCVATPAGGQKTPALGVALELKQRGHSVVLADVTGFTDGGLTVAGKGPCKFPATARWCATAAFSPARVAGQHTARFEQACASP